MRNKTTIKWAEDIRTTTKVREVNTVEWCAKQIF